MLDRILGKQQPAPVRLDPLEHRAGDQLVLLDSSWHADFFPLAERLKSEGVGIVSVIYDLIPLTHPQFCDAGLVKVFNHWFDWIVAMADGFICDLHDHPRRGARRDSSSHRGEEGRAGLVRLFPPGFGTGPGGTMPRSWTAICCTCSRPRRTGLPDGQHHRAAEEPRVPARCLRACLGGQGSSARLCIIGRFGWKCEALVARIRGHGELNKRLFMFNNLSDRSLEYAYSHAASLVFPSYVEGFGLPLVEAMQRDLPAMASDIPVFREVGGDFVAYFDLAAPGKPG